jgi:hypothetical protein
VSGQILKREILKREIYCAASVRADKKENIKAVGQLNITLMPEPRPKAWSKNLRQKILIQSQI